MEGASSLTVLRERDFALFFWGQAVSVLGDGIFPIALAFAVLDLGGSPTDLGIVLIAGILPQTVFVLIGGVWADRLPRRTIMLASDLTRALIQGVTAVLLLSGEARIWHLVVLYGLHATASAFFMPASTALVPQVTPQERLQEANALLGFTRSIASVAGPALAGILIAIGGPGDAIAVDAVTFALSAACLIALRPDRAPAVAGAEEHDGFAARLRAGWREVRRRPWLASGLGAMAAYHVFVLPAVWILGPALAASDLGGASSWAIIVACFGLGTIAGNLLALRLSIRRPVLVAAVALVGAATQAVIIGSGLAWPGSRSSSSRPASRSRCSSRSGTRASRSRCRPPRSRA